MQVRRTRLQRRWSGGQRRQLPPRRPAGAASAACWLPLCSSAATVSLLQGPAEPCTFAGVVGRHVGGPGGALPSTLPRQPGWPLQLNKHLVPRHMRLEAAPGRATGRPRELSRPAQRPLPSVTPHLLLGTSAGDWKGPEGVGAARKTGAVRRSRRACVRHGRPLRRAASQPCRMLRPLKLH